MHQLYLNQSTPHITYNLREAKRPQTTFIDATNPYNVEDPATGAQNGDAFVLTGDNTAAEIFGLNNNLLLMYGDNETLIDSNDTGSSIYALGSNDAITMVNDGPENVVVWVPAPPSTCSTTPTASSTSMGCRTIRQPSLSCRN